MSKPTIAAKHPFKVAVEEGKKYFWCSCGESKAQPFCDGAHKGSGMKPVVFSATESKVIYFCGCKHSAKVEICDGAHNKL